MDIIVRLLSITETEYYYLKALNLADSDAYDETINEPIKYPGNVHGGVGIVGVSTETSKIIHIEKPWIWKLITYYLYSSHYRCSVPAEAAGVC